MIETVWLVLAAIAWRAPRARLLVAILGLMAVTQYGIFLSVPAGQTVETNPAPELASIALDIWAATASALVIRRERALWARISVSCFAISLLAQALYWILYFRGTWIGEEVFVFSRALFSVQMACLTVPGGRELVGMVYRALPHRRRLVGADITVRDVGLDDSARSGVRG